MRLIPSRMTYTHTPSGHGTRLLTFLAAIALVYPSARSFAQGCVVARGAGHIGMMPHTVESSPWELSTAYRYFKSDRHFVGTTEQVHRQEEGSEVINRSHFVDLGVTYHLSPRYSLTLTVPYASHDRSSVVRDQNRAIKERFHVQSSGLGDIQVGGAGWLWDPVTPRPGNIQLGLGLVLPTGDEDVRDTFHAWDPVNERIIGVERTVDQSIQPGSGGWGINLNVYGYRELGSGFTAFASASYTVTPEDDNGVPTFRSSPYEQIMGIPDSYLARAGFEYLALPDSGVALSLALRMEGVPVHDLVGDNLGFRRPGYTVAIEPGISITRARWTARLYVPVAVQRNRQQSVPDKLETAHTGVFRQGDAAFADYLVGLSLSYRL